MKKSNSAGIRRYGVWVFEKMSIRKIRKGSKSIWKKWVFSEKRIWENGIGKLVDNKYIPTCHLYYIAEFDLI